MIETEERSLQEQFEEVIAEDNKLLVQDFLNNQNISDVVQLIEDNESLAARIISTLSVHRAASTFKILDLHSKTNYS